jgi:DUF1680 family protein
MTARIEDNFWTKRIAVTRQATLPAIYKQLRETGRWDAMKLTWKKGDSNEPHIFWDSDIAKLMESLCFALVHLDKSDERYVEFQQWIDDGIDMIEKAQGKDGYINIYYSVVDPKNRWTDLAHQHELYCAGHLLEASVAHYQLTGSSRFLDVMCKYVDYICTLFGPEPEKKQGYPGHEEVELALVKLYKIRPEKRYLNLLTFFIEERGKNAGEYYDKEAIAKGIDPMKYIPGIFLTESHQKDWPDPPCHWYMQADAPIRELTEIKGHSVRAMYYLTGVQGLANIIRDDSLTDSVNKLWSNMVDKKLYIHGGIGAIGDYEGFGQEYELPLNCYSETCASIGILFLGQRMLENKLNAEVARVMERALYNDVLGGVSLDGTSFYYDQPLVSRGHTRSSWFSVSCCPPNLSRLFNSLEQYAYSETENQFNVHLWIGGVYESKDFKAVVKTEYPFQGSVSVSLTSSKDVELAIRAPSEYKSSTPGTVQDGYIHFSPRHWNETVTLSFPIKSESIIPDRNVEAVRGKLAVERGPFVYALEQSSSSIDVKQVKLSRFTKFEESIVDIQGATVTALNTKVGEHSIQLLPYFVLGNRNPGENFVVWFDEE